MFAFADGEQALALSAESARITCQAPTLLDCCRLQSAMLHAALSGATRQTVLRPTISALNHPPLKPAVAKLIATTVQPGEQGTLVVHGADAVAALGAARWAFASTRNFRDGALAAVNLGGRSDVIGAVYGQLAGAFYGVDAIPSAWRTALVRRDKIEALADALLAHALTMLGISESA
jgi:ADP-ribosylglycohydrolase